MNKLNQLIYCPIDGAKLQFENKDGLDSYHCDSCDGNLIYKKNITKYQYRAIFNKILKINTIKKSTLKCCSCNQLMGVLFYEELVLDICKKCELIWFDTDEICCFKSQNRNNESQGFSDLLALMLGLIHK